MVTLREIAEKSGVSMSTVSRVLNGSASVSAGTRDRILAVARDLEYTPNGAARTLARRQSNLIAVVIGTGQHEEFQHPYFQGVLDGIKRAINARGYDVLLLSNVGPGFVRKATYHAADGMVLLGVSEEDTELARLVELRIPAMAIDYELRGERAGYVISDNRSGAEQAVAHLHAIGRRRIATITGMLTTTPGKQRLDGYLAAMESWGLEVPEGYVQRGDFYHATGYESMRRLLSLRDLPDAVFIASDMMALGALQALQEHGMRAPDDVAIVGFDDITFARWSRPSLSTIRQSATTLGATAADSLVGMLADDTLPPPHVVLPVELIVRDSSTRRPAPAESLHP